MTSNELTLKELCRIKSVKAEPFQLLLNDSAECFHSHEVIRIIPGKRLVALGVWGGAEVIAKIFYERGKSMHHLEREVSGIEALTDANVPTPRILYQGHATNNKRIQVILFEKICDAKSLEEVWQEQKNSEMFE